MIRRVEHLQVIHVRRRDDPTASQTCDQRSHDLARDDGVFVIPVHGAQAMVAIRDDDPSAGLVADEQNRREPMPALNLLAILLNVRIADAEEGQRGCAKDVLRLELRDPRAAQLGHGLRGCTGLDGQAQKRLGRVVIVRLRLREPPDRAVLVRHGASIREAYHGLIDNHPMQTHDAAPALARLFTELISGTSGRGGFVLNTGDIGLLRSLDHVSAADASRSVNGGATIAAHVQHLRYGLSLMNRWAAEGGNPFADAAWDEAWKTSVVDASEWAAIRSGLADEAHQWLRMLASPRTADETEFAGMVSSIAHLAYHVGAIRQINKESRGPREGTF